MWQALSPNKPGQGVGGLGIALASDGSVALLSGSSASGSQAASAYIYSFYTTAGQYNSCPQEIRVRLLEPTPCGADPPWTNRAVPHRTSGLYGTTMFQ